MGKEQFEMTEEQKELFERLAPLQQKVAINVVSGMSDIDAYESAGGKAKTKESARASVSQILTNLNVKAFVDSMKKSAVSSAIMSRQEMLERLSELANIDVSDLIKARPEELTEFKGGFDIKLKSALQAMKQLAELEGYNKPVEVNNNIKVGRSLSERLSGGSKR